MTCISDHAEVLLIYYKVESHSEEIFECYAKLEDAERRAESIGANSDYFVDIYEIRVIQDYNRIYVMNYYLKHF